MSWLLAIALALAAFALGTVVFGVARQGWTTFAAALALGLAGYAMQASPGVPGAPAADTREQNQVDWTFVDARKEMVASADRSASRETVTLTPSLFQREREPTASAARASCDLSPSSKLRRRILDEVEHRSRKATPPESNRR